MAGFDIAARGFGQERLIRHVAVGSDECYLRVRALETPFETECGVEADVTAAQDQDSSGHATRLPPKPPLRHALR